MSVGPASYDLLVTGGKMYLAPNLAYLKLQGVPAKYCAVLCGKFADIGGSAPSSLRLSAIFALAARTLNPGGMKKIINGLPAWVLAASDGTGYIAARGRPYLLRITAASTRDALDFTQWNTATIPGRPAASQMVDTRKLPH